MLPVTKAVGIVALRQCVRVCVFVGQPSPYLSPTSVTATASNGPSRSVVLFVILRPVYDVLSAATPCLLHTRWFDAVIGLKLHKDHTATDGKRARARAGKAKGEAVNWHLLAVSGEWKLATEQWPITTGVRTAKSAPYAVPPGW